MDNFCQGDLYNEIAKILENHLFNKNVNVVHLYENMIKHFQNDFPPDNLLTNLSINDLNSFNDFLSKKEDLRNLGIDLPVYFGSHKDSENKIMIVAMDPKRNGQETKEITLNSVFSLHSKKGGRETNRNDYWKFIEPLTQNSFVYITDIYKLYYETTITEKGRQQKLLSNKDKEFTGRDSQFFKLNKEVLNEEIKIVNPTKIISLGNEAAGALKTLKDIQTDKLSEKIDNIEYIFMPHISRTVTQSIKTIANLYKSIGQLKNDEKLKSIGEDILKKREKLFK